MDAKATGALSAGRRRERGLSQAELAERRHVTDKAVSRWETGRVLTAEELPQTAGGQLVESLKKNARMVWRGGGGKPSLTSGTLGSGNCGNPREAVIVFCGRDLPPEAAYYTFQNSGIAYTCPIENGRVLDLFLLPDTSDISSWPEQLLDKDGLPLSVDASENAATHIS